MTASPLSRAIGAEVREHRDRLGRTTTSFALELHLTQGSLSKIERGLLAWPWRSLERAAAAFDMPVSMLVELGERRAAVPYALARAEARDAAMRERAWARYAESVAGPYGTK